MVNGYQLRDRQDHGRRDLSHKPELLTSPQRRLIMFSGSRPGMICTHHCGMMMMMMIIIIFTITITIVVVVIIFGRNV